MTIRKSSQFITTQLMKNLQQQIQNTLLLNQEKIGLHNIRLRLIRFLLLMKIGEIIGWCSLSPHRPGRKALRTVAEISYYIHKDHRRKGVADNLISHTIDSAKNSGFKNLISILLDLNKTSIYILEKFGFEKWGHLPNIAQIDGIICGQYIYGKKL